MTSTSGGLGEAETAGVVLNVIPRDGGNRFSGTFEYSGASGGMQGSNYTQALKDAGLRTPSKLLKVWEVNPMGGGPILRDRLWFYLAYRETYAENTIPGMWFNKNGGDPTKWTVDFDLNRPAFNDTRVRNPLGRITWQVSPRNKINFQDSEQYSSANRTGGGSGTRTPEAQGLNLYSPGHTRVFTWTSPFTNRVLLEAGWGSYMANYANDAPRIDGQHNAALISVFDQGTSPGTGIPGLTYRFDNPLGGGFQHHQIGTLANLRASVSYITGAHNMKVGYQGGFSNPSQSYYNFTPYRSVPVQQRRAQPADADGSVRRHRRLGRRIRPQPRADIALRAGSVDEKPADAAGRPALRPHPHQLSRLLRRGPGLSADADADLLSGALDSGRPLERPDTPDRRRLRPVRQRQDGRQVEPREIHAGAHRLATATWISTR